MQPQKYAPSTTMAEGALLDCAITQVPLMVERPTQLAT